MAVSTNVVKLTNIKLMENDATYMFEHQQVRVSRSNNKDGVPHVPLGILSWR